MILRVLPCHCFKPTMCCLRLQTSGTPAPCLLVNLHRHLRLLMYSSLMKSFFLGFSACKHGHFPMAPWPHGQSAVSPGTRPTATRFRSWSCLRGTSGRIRNVPHAMQKKPRRSTKRLPGDWGIWMDPTIVLAHVYNMYIFMIMFVYN